MDANAENRYFAAAKRDVVGGLQFAFSCLTRATSTSRPWCIGSSNHNGFAQCGSGFSGPTPGVTCLNDGNTSFKPTWAVETNYYMDLGFLPESVQYFSISGRAAWYGKKGTDTEPLPFNPANNVFNTAVEFNSEPIRLTLDASKAMWGPKWSHFVDVWVAYRYWQNKFGLDHNYRVRLHQRRAGRPEQRLVHGVLGLRRHHREVLIAWRSPKPRRRGCHPRRLSFVDR